MSWPRRLRVVGHRGGRGDGWPRENTLAAFERARAEGAAAVELDVRTCLGGELVVFHDADLRRTTAGADSRLVSRVGRAELARLGVPTLEDVLQWAEGTGMGVNVELKHDVPDRRSLASAVAALLGERRRRDLRRETRELIVSSFDPLLLLAMAALVPRVPRALLTSQSQARYADVLRALARPRLVTALHIERTQASPEAVAAYLSRGLRVGAWTLVDPREAVDLARLGVDTLITDHPGTTVSALEAAGFSPRS